MSILLKPPSLQRGDTIGIVATSFPLPRKDFPDSEYIQQYKKGVSTLESMGFKTKEAPNLDKVKWWFAGTAEERASDINHMFQDSEVKAIIVHEGGNSAISVLEYIDYELVKKNPKPFIGFSDVTSIHSALFVKTGLVGFHGPLLTYSLGNTWDQCPPNAKNSGKDRLFYMLTSNQPLGLVEPFTVWQCWREGAASGRLYGGNLSRLTSLIGTSFFPELSVLEGALLFWEIDGVKSYQIEKHLVHLKYSGVLDKIAGMLIGKLPDIERTAWKDMVEPTPKELIMEVLKDFEFPILADIDFGHKTVDTVMPIGIKATMNAKKRNLEFLESTVI